jgi:hypothetical protein
MSRPRTPSTHSDVASVHNYYERLVAETIYQSSSRAASDNDFMADVSCVALNHLPPRYIRHDVDMSFFMSPAERTETANKVQQAVDHAIQFVVAHEQEKHETDEKERLANEAAETSAEAIVSTSTDTNNGVNPAPDIDSNDHDNTHIDPTH